MILTFQGVKHVNIDMVYDEKTLQAMHPLTEEGQKAYSEMLERKADEILYRHKHPFKYLIRKILRKG